MPKFILLSQLVREYKWQKLRSFTFNFICSQRWLSLEATKLSGTRFTNKTVYLCQMNHISNMRKNLDFDTSGAKLNRLSKSSDLFTYFTNLYYKYEILVKYLYQIALWRPLSSHYFFLCQLDFHLDINNFTKIKCLKFFVVENTFKKRDLIAQKVNFFNLE